MKLYARAKINLDLRILARESSGYHQIETLFCRLELADELEVTPTEADFALEVDGPPLGPPEQNLVARAARAFAQRTGEEPGARIRLVKRIPVGAGLGGGSSDAAATLLALNRLRGDPLHPGELLELGASLGADVPFFAADTPLALAWGRGERLLPLDALPRAHVLLAVPPFAVSTAEAYALADQGPPEAVVAGRVHQAADYRTWTAFAPNAANDFEPVLFPLHPRLPELKDALSASGAFLALMTGSGSAVFGLYHSGGSLQLARASLAADFPDVELHETATDAGEREDLLG